MTAFRLAAAPLLLMAAAHAAWAAPEDSLLAELSGEFREPQLSCEWIAGRFHTIERRLSLYREELAAVQVLVDGIRVGDSTNGAVMLLAFESRLIGPASVTIALDMRRASALDRLRPGRRIDITFTDRAGKTHPLFCGPAALVRPNPATGRADVVALVPRAGAELQMSAQYQQQNCADVLANVAQSAGLSVEVFDQRPQTVFAVIERKNLAAWPFIRQLARQCRMEIRLQADGRITASASGFAEPPRPAARSWVDLTWVDIAAQLAAQQGRAPDTELSGAYPRMTVRQETSDEEFLLDISIAARASAWYTPGKLLLREDGAWSQQPGAPVLPKGFTDLLLKRVIVTGSGAAPREFRRRIADAAGQSRDPEHLPMVEARLALGRAMPAAALPAVPLADGARIAAGLDGALTRLDAQSAAGAERLFLRDLARVYRPTLHHLYRLRTDGAKTLDAIGR